MLIHDGWIKLHRKIIDHPFYGDPEFLSVWITLLLRATHIPINKNWNGKTITLKPGQLIASRKTLSFMTGVNQSKVYRLLKRLENEQQIEQQKSPRSTIITITNWEKYQSGEQPNEQQMNSYRTTTEQLPVKNIRREEKKNIPPSVEASLIGKEFADHVKRMFNGSIIKESEQIKYAQILIDLYGDSRVRTVCKAIIEDDRPGFNFRDNIRTLGKLNVNWQKKGRKWFLEVEDFIAESGRQFQLGAFGAPGLDKNGELDL